MTLNIIYMMIISKFTIPPRHSSILQLIYSAYALLIFSFGFLIGISNILYPKPDLLLNLLTVKFFTVSVDSHFFLSVFQTIKIILHSSPISHLDL